MARARRILLRMADGTVHECEILAGEPFVVGRGRDAHLRLDTKSVSRQHCRLELDPETGALSLVDLGSQNGTLLNGRRVDRALLRSGDQVQIGLVAFAVEVLEPGAAPARAPAAPAPPAPALSPSDEVAAILREMGLHVRERVDLGSAVPVYRAFRPALEQEVRVKAVSVSDEEHAQRLLREARVAARMRHPGIVQVYDVKRERGVVAIIYEWVEGRSLADEIRRLGRLDPVRALEIGADVATALTHAHSLGVVHRDITPSTIVLTSFGAARIVDFGLAKSIRPRSSDGAREGSGERALGELTQAGRGLGAVEYAPPEQTRCAATVDHRADIYAVGSTLYHALAGEPPLVQVNPAAPDDPSADVPAPLSVVAPELPSAARDLIDRAMAPAPDDRYASALHLLRALEGARAQLEAEAGLEHGTALIEVGAEDLAGDPEGPVHGLTSPGTRTPPPGRLALAGAAGSPTSFVGRIQVDEMVELLQMVEHNRKSGTLQIFGSADAQGRRLTGTVLFRGGKIVDARAADRRGQDALFELVSLRSGDFSVVYGEPPPVEGEGAPLHISAALFEALRRRDESKRRRSPT
jgi:hypothetical protein